MFVWRSWYVTSETCYVPKQSFAFHSDDDQHYIRTVQNREHLAIAFTIVDATLGLSFDAKCDSSSEIKLTIILAHVQSHCETDYAEALRDSALYSSVTLPDILHLR